MKSALYGTRIASQLFQNAVRKMYIENGWTEIEAVPCTFYEPIEDTVSGHHGDDFFTEAEPEFADKFDEML